MSRGGIEKRIVSADVVALGDNEFETGVINVAAGVTIKAGVVLARNGGKFVPVIDTATQTPVAVNPFDIPNKESTAQDLSIRAIISGPVRANLLTVNGVKTTVDQNDKLRSYTIIPILDHDLSITG